MDLIFGWKNELFPYCYEKVCHFVFIVDVVSVQDPNSMDAEEGPVSLLQAQVGRTGFTLQINVYCIGHASHYQKSLVHYRVY